MLLKVRIARILFRFWPKRALYFPETGTLTGAPLSFKKNTRNFAGCVALAFFETA
jgi:hypothetical protein